MAILSSYRDKKDNQEVFYKDQRKREEGKRVVRETKEPIDMSNCFLI